MNLYAYRLNLKAQYHAMHAWTAETQAVLERHATFLKRGMEAGGVCFIGRSDADLARNFGLVLFQAESLADAEAYKESDPAVLEGIMVGEVFPFKLLMVTDAAKAWNVW